VKRKDNQVGMFVSFSIIVSLILVLSMNSPSFSEDLDARCIAGKQRWEDTLQSLKEKLQVYVSIQQTPADRIAQQPVLRADANKTIAKQISDALEAKEEVLSAKRKECRNLLNLESQIFAEVQECLSLKHSKDKNIKNTVKNRQALVDKAILTIAEVREVEGKETFVPYDAMGDPDPYRRSVNNYWQNYMQMYRQWWGR
jgi:hypothetical protein